ncbi:O-methyltransferase [uncultured Bacteroides sp.]|uniref:O-methyltransferase n=1 Tax=uncultured Bacteroides sp. TaxID=162156 RepID=UPI00280AA015|nr:O-methyltransferase [uncultured Bacteroides sp.]
MDSFEKINYSIRPNKCIERKMICEVLSRLSFIDDLKNYRYIGFGSTYFTDFTLFHKQLGIDNLISIESAENKKERFELNKPFSCIQILYGEATTLLPNLELDKKNNIIWLDYDGVLEDYMFGDIDTIVSSAKEGSAFMISVNVAPLLGTQEEKFKTLVQRVGKQRIPIEFYDANLNGNKFIEVVYQMIDMQIKKSLSERNGSNSKRIEYKQIFNYLYKDGVSMLTIGGIIYNIDQKQSVNRMKLHELTHVRSGNDQYKIQCPNLTYKEIHLLNSLLPCELKINKNGDITNKEFKKIPLASNDIKDYSEIYRYYPNYAETNL